MAAQEEKYNEVANSVTEEQRLELDRKLMEKGIDPNSPQEIKEAIEKAQDPDGLTQELLDIIPGADQLTPEQRRSLINSMSLQDVSPAMQAGRDYYNKFTGNSSAPLGSEQVAAVEDVQMEVLQALQKKGEMLKGMDPVKAGFNGAMPTMDLGREAAPNTSNLPDMGPAQGTEKGGRSS